MLPVQFRVSLETKLGSRPRPRIRLSATARRALSPACSRAQRRRPASRRRHAFLLRPKTTSATAASAPTGSPRPPPFPGPAAAYKFRAPLRHPASHSSPSAPVITSEVRTSSSVVVHTKLALGPSSFRSPCRPRRPASPLTSSVP